MNHRSTVTRIASPADRSVSSARVTTVSRYGNLRETAVPRPQKTFSETLRAVQEGATARIPVQASATGAKAMPAPARATMAASGTSGTGAATRTAAGRKEEPAPVASLRSRFEQNGTLAAPPEAPKRAGTAAQWAAREVRDSQSAEAASATDLSTLVYRILHPHPGDVKAGSPAAKTARNATKSGDGEVWQGIIDDEVRVSSEYGLRPDPFTGRNTFHDGLDLAASKGAAIHPVSSGVVTFSGWNGGYGRMVTVRHADGTETNYCHASSIAVSKGDRVTQQTKIAEVGSTGRSTGPHLHLEVRRNGESIDPQAYLRERQGVRLAKAR